MLDEIPDFLRLTAEERHAHWEKNPPRSMPVFHTPKPAKEETPEQALKRQTSINKMKARIGRARQRNERVPGSVWDPRTSHWVHPNGERVSLKNVIGKE